MTLPGGTVVHRLRHPPRLAALPRDQEGALNYNYPLAKENPRATDIVSDDEKGGSARVLDLTRKEVPFVTANPRCAERAATALFLYSVVGTRGQGRRGASEPELKKFGGIGVPPKDASNSWMTVAPPPGEDQPSQPARTGTAGFAVWQ